MNWRKEFFPYLLLIGAVCFLMTGCQETKPAGPLVRVTLAIPSNMGSILEKIADSRGFFREEGLDVALQENSSGKAALQSVLAGKADLSTTADTPIMFAIMHGADISVLATVLTSNRDLAIVARKDRGIAGAADLRGRKIGVTPGTNCDYFLDSYLVIQGITRQEVEIVNIQPEQMADALTQGRVDAVSTWNPIVAKLVRALGDRVCRLHSEIVYTETFNIVSKRAFPREHPETVRRLLRALLKAEDFAAADPKESQRIISQFNGMDRALLATIWHDFQLKLTLRQSLPVTLEDQARWAMENGLAERRALPNFFEALYVEGLKSVKPDAVRVIR